MTMTAPLIHVRTPTYRRPEALARALRSVIAQGWQNWIVDVYDDDPKQAGRQVCSDVADPRIRYHANSPQRFASKNIDMCFSAQNPHAADYFCVLEDDNYLLPGFFAENVELCHRHGVEVVLRNQLVEHQSATFAAHLSKAGVLDELFVEGAYDPDAFRLSLLVGIGVSNGGLFWSKHARSRFEVGFSCTATIQEYMRTFSVDEPIYVAMSPLAVWAENGEQTTRNAELRASYLRRELDLKRHIQALQRLAWRHSSPSTRRTFLSGSRLAVPRARRAKSLAKALIAYRPNEAGWLPTLQMALRGAGIRVLGRLSPEFAPFLASRASIAKTV